MVLTFFRRHEDDGLSGILHQLTAMLGDARHSFDLSMSTVVSGADPVAVGAEVRATDHRINQSEQDVRRKLLVHAAVQGATDIEIVLGYLLLSRKVERIGDQAKNILDLAEEGVSLVDGPDAADLVGYRDRISNLFGTVSGVLTDPRDDNVEPARTEGLDLATELEGRLRDLIHSDQPASFAVPRALLFRYLKRTAANLAGIVSSVIDPFDQVDYPGGADTDD